MARPSRRTRHRPSASWTRVVLTQEDRMRRRLQQRHWLRLHAALTGGLSLAGMSLLTLLPLGILQLNAALEHGYWFARSAEFMQQPIVDMLVWMRVPADTLFSVGALALAWFVASLWLAPRRELVPVAQPSEA